MKVVETHGMWLIAENLNDRRIKGTIFDGEWR